MDLYDMLFFGKRNGSGSGGSDSGGSDPGGAGEEYIKHAEIPAYVKNEALALAAKVKAVQTANSITFMIASDAHQWDPDDGNCDTAEKKATAENIIAGNLHAGMAMKVLAYALKLDFVAFLGDYTAGAPTTTSNGVTTAGTTIEEGLAHIGSINRDIDEAFKNLPQFRTTGNHDPLTYSYSTNGDYLSEEELYDLIGTYNGIDGETVFGDDTAGYCYRDFTDKKVRVICLNTSENTAEPSGNYTSEKISTEQCDWFVHRLDEVGKKGTDWSVIILSHHPLDWAQTLANANRNLQAYVSGGVGYAELADFSFDSNNNLARIVGNFHGHTHCYKYAQMQYDNADYDAYRIAIPNMCLTRNNEYGQYNHNYEFGETVTYEKTANSATDTAFCVVTVDLTNKIIYAFHYGAGPTADDKCRAIPYDFNVTYHHVNSTVIKGRLTGPVLVQNGGNFSGMLQPDDAAFTDVKIKHDGTDVTSTAYNSSTGAILIENVAGDIEIYAAPYTNQVLESVGTDNDGNTFTGSLPGWRLNSRGTISKASTSIVSGLIPYDGEKIRIAQLRKNENMGNTGFYIRFYQVVNGTATDIGSLAGTNTSEAGFGLSVSNQMWIFDPETVTNTTVANRVESSDYIQVSLAYYSTDMPFTVTLDEEF